MAKRHLPGSTIGIIGSSISSALLAQAAGKLGYRVASLVLDENNPVRQFSSWQTVTENYNDQVLKYFADRVDIVTSEIGLLTNRQYQLMASMTDVGLSDDLIAITTDRLLEKNFLDNHRSLIAPYSLVTDIGDIEEAVEYLGFPCVLKATQRHVYDAKNHLILYSEEDYPEAIGKLANGSCVLEAWIPIEKKVSLTVVRNERGEMLLYPIFEVAERAGGNASQVQFPANINEAIQQEINRVGQSIAQNVQLVGTMTIHFFVTSAGVIYVNEASVGLGNEAMFTMGSMSMSHYEATARGLLGLPLPELRIHAKAAIALPIEQLNRENALMQYMLRTDWGFALFNPVGNDPDYLIGQVIVTGDSLRSCERQIELTELI
ncbi:ATP-grasp domain-containing protein [Aerococcaceae bacterium DSM 111022]|nr:ATP-grasp domain-containing protein [Aerococcaceae bacterium DSM 111022]